MHGRGKLVFSGLKSEYIGGFRFGSYHGLGQYKANGEVTVGIWKEGHLEQIISKVWAQHPKTPSDQEIVASALISRIVCLPEPFYWPVLHRNFVHRSQICHSSGRWNPIPQSDKSPKELPPPFCPPALVTANRLTPLNSSGNFELACLPSNEIIPRRDVIRKYPYKLERLFGNISHLRSWLLRLL